MVQMLSLGSVAHELDRQQLTALLAPELARPNYFPTPRGANHPPVSAPGQNEMLAPELQHEEEAQPATPQPAPPPSRRRHSRHRAPLHRSRRLAALYDRRQEWLEAADAELRPGSNNWVVSGAHTASGKPLLSNDMHLSRQIPNVWYQAHLTSGFYDVAGVTLPGVPYVIAGHNQRIAWGFTNLGPAVADLFIETFNPHGEYQTPEGWQQPEHHREVIRVRRGKLLNWYREVAIDVVVTGARAAGFRPQPECAGIKRRGALPC